METPQTPTAQFGALRSLLHTPGWSFAQLVAFLDQCKLPPEHIERELIPYASSRCDQLLKDEDRDAPDHWIDALERGEELIGWPLVRVARLSSLNQVLEQPSLLSELTSLTLAIEHTTPFNELIRRPELARLKQLWASFQLSRSIEPIFGLGDPLIDNMLWGQPHLSQLEQLSLQGAFIKLGFPPAHHSAMDKLTRLELKRAQLMDKGCERFAQQSWPSLTQLNLDGNDISAEGVEALMRAPWAAQLTELDLSDNSLDERALIAILDHTRLESLTLDSTKLSAQALLNTIDHPGWSSIKHLSLSWLYTLGDGVIEAMAASPRFANLESLSLIWGGLSTRSARALAGSPYITGLKRLDLYRNQLDDHGAQALAASENFGQLEWLRVHDNDISDAGRKVMRQSKALAYCIERLGANGF